MVQTATLFQDLSQVLSHAEAIRAWVKHGRMPGDQEQERAVDQDPLAFMNLAANAGLSPLSRSEQVTFRARSHGREEKASSVRRESTIPTGQPEKQYPDAGEIPANEPRSARSDGASGIVDARKLFEARARERGMAAVETGDDLFGPRVRVPIQLEDWRAPSWAQVNPMLLSGEGMILWYRVDPGALAERVDVSPSLVVGRGLACVCVGRYRSREAGVGAEEGTLLEVTLSGLVRGKHGLELLPVSRLVESTSRTGGLRGLAMHRPREMAHIQIDPTPGRWSVMAQWRAGRERLELEVESNHWLNRFGVGPLLSVLLPIRGARWPVGGGQARLQLDPRTRLRVGRATRVHLPEHFHQGLLTPPAMAHPLSVTLAPRMSLSTFPDLDGE